MTDKDKAQEQTKSWKTIRTQVQALSKKAQEVKSDKAKRH